MSSSVSVENEESDVLSVVHCSQIRSVSHVLGSEGWAGLEDRGQKLSRQVKSGVQRLLVAVSVSRVGKACGGDQGGKLIRIERSEVAVEGKKWGWNMGRLRK